MTGIVGRLNAALLKRIQKDRPAVAVDGAVVVVDGKRFLFADVDAVIAYRQPGYAGDRLTLAITYASGARLEIAEGTAAWTAIRAELDRQAHVMPSTEWYPRLIASGMDPTPLVVFQKAKRPRPAAPPPAAGGRR